MDNNTFSQNIIDAESVLYHISKSILINEADCEDAVSEAVLKAYEKLYTLKDEQYFRTWLIRIMINECYKILRKKRPVISYEDSLSEEEYESKDYMELYGELTCLEPRIRIAVVLYYVEGYSLEEIKSILKIPLGTVKSRLSRGRKILKNKLESEE
ncbi:MAG: RNA polymerase sigma factor [Lachnospiraceae bacterium]|nr:RNA polymerase sigma factor [Lachnospiraceae bacterium]